MAWMQIECLGHLYLEYAYVMNIINQGRMVVYFILFYLHLCFVDSIDTYHWWRENIIFSTQTTVESSSIKLQQQSTVKMKSNSSGIYRGKPILPGNKVQKKPMDKGQHFFPLLGPVILG